jgi:hypothetical protein
MIAFLGISSTKKASFNGRFLALPSFESKIARNRACFEELILMLKEIKPEGWRKEVKHAKKMIKAIDRMNDLNRLEKLRDVCKSLARRYRKQSKNPEKIGVSDCRKTASENCPEVVFLIN